MTAATHHAFHTAVLRSVAAARTDNVDNVDRPHVVASLRDTIGGARSSALFQTIATHQNSYAATHGIGAIDVVRSILDVQGLTKIKFTQDALETLCAAYVLLNDPTTPQTSGEIAVPQHLFDHVSGLGPPRIEFF